MRFKIKKTFLVMVPLAAIAADNCAQDGKILARIGFVISEHNLGDKMHGADAYEDAVKKDVEIFSKTMDAVFVATEDYVPPGLTKDDTVKKNGIPVTHIQLESFHEQPFIERLSKFEKQVKTLIDANPKFKELYGYPGDKASKEDLEKYYNRARSGIQLVVAGSDHGSPDLEYKDTFIANGFARAKLDNLSGEISPSRIGSLGKSSFQSMAQAFRGMPTMQLYGQCFGNDVGRAIVDAQITENKKIDQNFECSCFAAQGQAFMVASFPRVGQQFESEPFKNLDHEQQKYTLLQAAARGIKNFDLTSGAVPDEDSEGGVRVSHYAKDSGMTGSETTFLSDVKREFGGDHPSFFSFKNPGDLSVVQSTKKDGTPLFTESEQRALLQSEIERIKAVYSNFGKNVTIDTGIHDVKTLYEYASEKRREVMQMLSQYKQTREQQTSSVLSIENKKKILMKKIASLRDLANDKFQKTNDHNFENAFSAVYGTLASLFDKVKALDTASLKGATAQAKNWNFYLEVKKQVAGFRLQIAAVSGFLYNAYKDLNQEALKKLESQIQDVVDSSDAFMADLIEPVKPVLIAETILSRTLVEAKTMKYMTDKDDATLAKKKEEFFRQRHCELMDIRPNGEQMYRAGDKAVQGGKDSSVH